MIFIRIDFYQIHVDQWIRSIIEQIVRRQDSGAEKRVQKSKIYAESVVGHSLTFLLEGYESSSIMSCHMVYMR